MNELFYYKSWLFKLKNPHLRRAFFLVSLLCLLLMTAVWMQVARPIVSIIDTIEMPRSDVNDFNPHISRMRELINPEPLAMFMSRQAKDLGIEVVSATIVERSVVTQPAELRWQLQIILRGSYPAIKQFIRDALGRYAGVIVISARWARISNSMSSHASVSIVESQIQLGALNSI